MTDQLALNSPGSPDTPMEGHVQTAKMAVLNFGQPQDLAGLTHMDITMAYPGGRHPADSYGPGRIENRLALWYHRNDGPWTPAGLTHIRNPSLLGNLRNSHFPLYGQYRDSPSECDTIPPAGIPSDSGYGGSHVAKHSVANDSVCDESTDRNPESIGELGFHSYGQDMASRINSETPWSQSQPTSTSPQSAVPLQVNPDGGKTCEKCHKVLKTKSEFKKHKQRHDKPFKCTVKGCTRREGFSTPNDLERHKRSLHPEEDAVGDRYRCQVGLCVTKGKIWPRADNFRAHMKRVHQIELSKDEELDQYKCRYKSIDPRKLGRDSNYFVRPAVPSKDTSHIVQDTVAPELDRSTIFPDADGNDASGSWKLPRSPVIDIPADTGPSEEQNETQTEGTPSGLKPSESRLDESNSNTAQTMHLERKNTPFDTQTEIPKPLSPQPGPALGDLEPTKIVQLRDEPGLHPEASGPELANNSNSLNHQQTSAVDESRDRPSELSLRSLESDIQSERLINDGEKGDVSAGPRDRELQILDLNNPEYVSKLLEELQDKGILQKHGFKKEEPQEADITNQEATGDVVSQQAHTCSQCQKLFQRRCELKKHEKRHLKPYGCTFRGCNKKFGSKNDWKRHENSQHIMLEQWICDEMQTEQSTKPCGRNFPRRELFKHHLGTSHNIKEQEYMERKLETCRVGRNLETRFWCGFCQQVIETTKEGIEAWAERFNHIDDHFQGRNNQMKRDIDNWKSIDLNSITPSGPASSSNSPNTRSNEAEKPHTRVSNHKRKRDYDLDSVASKRAEILDIHAIMCVCVAPSSSALLQ
ncbi:hypothetical protein F4774DRAFT_423901 [Daldinia eschscholtzii]|nr:hypothetical protein F4774DRAFT_423901 [Daldinia eschscholtzii]